MADAGARRDDCLGGGECVTVRGMSIKLVVLYAQPADPTAFDGHYLKVHVPLAKKVPGLQRFEGSRIAAALDGGEQTYFRIAELYFSDQAALQAGLGSKEGQATAADYQQIAPPGSRMFTANVD
ncbi:MAG TPA: EthD family reductase [Polyangiales bacterium]